MRPGDPWRRLQGSQHVGERRSSWMLSRRSKVLILLLFAMCVYGYHLMIQRQLSIGVNSSDGFEIKLIYQRLMATTTERRLSNRTDNYLLINEQPYPGYVLSVNQSGRVARAQKRAVLLVAYYRGGSTLIGELLNLNRRVFFWYEPLIWRFRDFQAKWNLTKNDYRLTHSMKGYDSLAEEFKVNDTVKAAVRSFHDQVVTDLQRLLSCDLASLPEPVLTHNFLFFRQKNNPRRMKYQTCLSKNTVRNCLYLLEEACNEATFIAIKTIRMSVTLAKKVADKIGPQVKIVYLSRDPRGMVLSRGRLEYKVRAHLADEACYLCAALQEDAIAASRLPPAGAVSLRYEDFASAPQQSAARVYSMVGMPVTEFIKSWVKAQTEIKSSAERQAGMNHAEWIAFRWKRLIKPQQKSVIDRQCGAALTELGYTQ